MKLKKGKRVLAIVMAALMVIGIMPMDWALSNASAADPTTYTFDATTLTAEADKEALTGTVADGFVTVTGKVTKRISSTTGAVTSTELEKSEKGSYEFTVTGTADVKLVVSSTGGSNDSVIGIKDAEGQLVKNNEDIVKVSTTSKTTLTYTSLAAGTYKVVVPQGTGETIEDGENGTIDLAEKRGARVYSIEIAEVPASTTATYTFDATTLTAEADKEALTGTVADGFVTVTGKVTKRISSTTGAVTSTELEKSEKGSYEFTVTGTADVKLVVSSTGGSNDSVIGIKDAEGQLVKNNEDIVKVSTTSKTTLTYTSLAAGTYKVVVPQGTGETIEDGENGTIDLAEKRGARVYSIEIVETTGGSRPPRADWSTVAAPEMGEITVDGSKITVPYTMVTGYDGADSVVITMKAADGTVAETETASGTANGGQLVFTPAASGTYTFSIAASRKDETDKVGAAEKAVEFVLPLGKSIIGAAYSLGSGDAAVEWSAVEEAEAYTVEYSADGTEWKSVEVGNAQTATLHGLTADTKYTVRVVAKRGTETTVSATVEFTATAEAQQRWASITYGNGASASKDSFTGSANDGSVTISSASGKIVPASYDGLSFYYTTVPASQNFTLRAKVSVDSWKFSNGQEGFGLMAADQLGGSGWNNSYMAVSYTHLTLPTT